MKYQARAMLKVGHGGFRYLIARWFGMYMGIDVAAGPEGWAWYIVMGSNWLGK